LDDIEPPKVRRDVSQYFRLASITAPIWAVKNMMVPLARAPAGFGFGQIQFDASQHFCLRLLGQHGHCRLEPVKGGFHCAPLLVRMSRLRAARLLELDKCLAILYPLISDQGTPLPIRPVPAGIGLVVYWLLNGCRLEPLADPNAAA